MSTPYRSKLRLLPSLSRSLDIRPKRFIRKTSMARHTRDKLDWSSMLGEMTTRESGQGGERVSIEVQDDRMGYEVWKRTAKPIFSTNSDDRHAQLSQTLYFMIPLPRFRNLVETEICIELCGPLRCSVFGVGWRWGCPSWRQLGLEVGMEFEPFLLPHQRQDRRPIPKTLRPIDWAARIIMQPSSWPICISTLRTVPRACAMMMMMMVMADNNCPLPRHNRIPKQSFDPSPDVSDSREGENIDFTGGRQ